MDALLISYIWKSNPKQNMKLKALNLIAGVCLLIVTAIEVYEERATLKIEAEHGLLIYAIAHVLSGAVGMYEGINKIREEKRQAEL